MHFQLRRFSRICGFTQKYLYESIHSSNYFSLVDTMFNWNFLCSTISSSRIIYNSYFLSHNLHKSLFTWTSHAIEIITKLKQECTCAPILVHVDQVNHPLSWKSMHLILELEVSCCMPTSNCIQSPSTQKSLTGSLKRNLGLLCGYI